MYLIKFFLFLAVFIFLSASGHTTDLNKPLGFEFGASKKDVKKMIEEKDILILRDEDQTKDIKRLIVNGSLNDAHVVSATHHETRLEFYKNKLMSSALFYKFEDSGELFDAKDEYLNRISDEFGEPTGMEKMLTYKLWTWNLATTRILLSSNNSSKSLKVEFLHEPLMSKKIEKEIDKKLYGEAEDPAKKTFIDGDFSKPKYGR